jgi:hypothetical protein
MHKLLPETLIFSGLLAATFAIVALLASANGDD